MANETTKASLAGVPAFWREKALKARYAKGKIWKTVLNAVEGDPGVVGKITKMGDTIHFTKMPTLTVGNVTIADGSFTNQVVTTSDVTIVVNLWRIVAVDVVDLAGIQTSLDWKSEFSTAFGEAIGEDQDVQLLTEMATVTGIIGGAQAFSDALILLGMRTLDDSNVPEEGRHWALSPVAVSDLLALDKFTLANSTGFSRGIQTTEGNISGLYGVPVHKTPKVITASGVRENMLYHNEAFGVATQRNFKIEELARTKLSTPYIGHILYGLDTLRNDHALRVQSQA